MRSPLLPILATAQILAAAPARLAAQVWGNISGPSLDRFSEAEYRFVAVSYRRTTLAQDGVGVDFGLGIVRGRCRASHC